MHQLATPSSGGHNVHSLHPLIPVLGFCLVDAVFVSHFLLTNDHGWQLTLQKDLPSFFLVRPAAQYPEPPLACSATLEMDDWIELIVRKSISTCSIMTSLIGTKSKTICSQYDLTWLHLSNAEFDFSSDFARYDGKCLKGFNHLQRNSFVSSFLFATETQQTIGRGQLTVQRVKCRRYRRCFAHFANRRIQSNCL